MLRTGDLTLRTLDVIYGSRGVPHVVTTFEEITSPTYTVHVVERGRSETLCGKRIAGNWMKGRTLPKRECGSCEVAQARHYQ